MVKYNYHFIGYWVFDFQYIKMKLNLEGKNKIETGKSRDFPPTSVSFSMKQL